MRLLRMEASGFKSFCDKTVLSFVQKGISVVVGPNGCGKSNIVDAIRWTLGEQSAKHLRGSSMEDVIFNGSDSRQPVSMAQVTLVFSNPEHDTIPKYSEFSEISITRRLYRSGESKYLINKTACRLTDIRELFMDTGIGGKGYSIIEQGKIDQIITSRAEDRRMIIDEAAGIVKFKAKKKEAERKFAATKQNLLRVEDVLTELERQEETLSDQVKRADEYLNAKGRLERLQHCISAKRWYNLKEQSTKQSKSREENVQTLNDLNNAVSSIEAKESAIELEITSKSVKLSDFQAESQQRKEEIIKLESSLETDKLSLNNLDEWEKKNKDEIDLLNKQIKTVEFQLETLTSDSKKLDADIEVKSGMVEQLQEQEKVSENQLSDQRTKLEKSQQEEVDIITRTTGEQNQLEQLNERLSEVREREKDAESKLAQIKADEDKVNKTLEEVSTALKKRKEQKQSCQDAIESRQEKKDEQEQTIAELNAKIKSTAQEHNQAENRYQSLQEFIQNHEEYDTATKKLLELLDNDENLKKQLGFKGTLAETISPVEEILPQTTAFLNRYFNLLIFSSVNKLKEIVALVKKEDIEQLQLCFLDLISSETGKTKNSLAETIPCKPELEMSIPFVDLFQAIEKPVYTLSKKQLLQSEGLIDSDASVMTKSKIFLIGQPGKSNIAEAFLKRRSEIAQLESTLKKIAGDLENLEEMLESETETLDELNRVLKSAQKELVDLDLEIVGQEKEFDAKTIEEQRVNSSHQSLLSEQKQIEDSKAQFVEKIDALTKSIKENSQKQENLQETLKELRSQIDRAESSKEEYTDELQHLKVILAGSKEKQQNNLEAVERLAADILQRQNQLKEIETRTMETEGRRKETLSSIEKTTAQLPGLLKKLEESIKKQTDLTNEIETNRAELLKLKEFIALEQKKAGELKEKNYKVDIKLAQLAQEGKNIEDNLYAESSIRPEEIIETFDIRKFNIDTETENIAKLKLSIGGMDDVNLAAKSEYDTLKERLDFLNTQSSDLLLSIEALENSINKINMESRKRFRDTFKRVNEEFSKLFPQLFGGGEAYLRLTDESDLLEAGVDIIAQPPGKKLVNMTLLSGGEKALTAIALVFAVFMIKPSPFCLLDEVDAPLDDANNVRFNEHVKAMTDNSQFIIITHNKKTMEIGDSLFGITMEEAGISKVVSVDFASFNPDSLQKAI